MAEGELRHHGLNVERNPLAKDATTDGPPEQQQEWPRREQAMHPPADHSAAGRRAGSWKLPVDNSAPTVRRMATPDAAAALNLLRSSSLARALCKTIEEMILRGELLAGQRINENGLAAHLAVSRGPVREALRALEQAGLVKVVARRGVFVEEVSLKEALDAYDICAGLFGLAGATLASCITDKQLTELDKLLAKMDEVHARGAAQEYYPLNLEFHSRLVEYSGNKELARIYGALVKKLHLYGRKKFAGGGGVQASIREHRQIVKVLARRDPEAARQVMEGHVLAGKRRLLKPAPVSAELTVREQG